MISAIQYPTRPLPVAHDLDSNETQYPTRPLPVAHK